MSDPSGNRRTKATERDRQRQRQQRERKKYRIDERINVTTTKNNQQQQREKSSSNQELDPKVLLRIADEMLHPIVETHPWLFWRQRARAEPNSEIQRPRVENVYLCRSLVILSSGNGDTSQNRKRFCIQTHNAALQSSGLLFLSLSFSDSLTLPVSLSLSLSPSSRLFIVGVFVEGVPILVHRIYTHTSFLLPFPALCGFHQDSGNGVVQPKSQGADGHPIGLHLCISIVVTHQ